jgi:arsenite methyltransferase
MAKLQVYEKPMCCSTGICGPKIDPVLPAFAADLAWLSSQGVKVERFNLSQQPQAFVANKTVFDAIRSGHESVLPMVIVNGKVVSKGTYPSRDQLATWCLVARPVVSLQAAPAEQSCCGPQECC